MGRLHRAAPRSSGADAFERAGVTPDDIDLCCIYDAFTSMVLLTLEELGFCKKGEGGPFVEDGKLRLGGALPTNTDGGGLSACHPGMRGLFLLVEAARQLRGDAAAGRERQVADAELACVSGTGGWFCATARSSSARTDAGRRADPGRSYPSHRRGRARLRPGRRPPSRRLR